MGIALQTRFQRNENHMLIVFGIGATLQLLASSIYTCERCGNHSTHNVLKQRRKLSIFFIPVLTVGKASFLDECTACGRVLEISEADAEVAAVRVTSGPQDSPTWSPQDR